VLDYPFARAKARVEDSSGYVDLVIPLLQPTRTTDVLSLGLDRFVKPIEVSEHPSGTKGASNNFDVTQDVTCLL
jgi:hypothetical protein